MGCNATQCKAMHGESARNEAAMCPSRRGQKRPKDTWLMSCMGAMGLPKGWLQDK